MIFEEAFTAYIQNQVVVSWGFQLLTTIKQPNGYLRDIGGYYTLYENGYRLIISGESLGKTPIQEALILDQEGMPVARDTEDLRRSVQDEE
jgi:hypothetical protein